MKIYKLARQFLEYFEKEKKRSVKTIANYNFYLNRFLNWAEIHKIKEISEVNHERIREYGAWLNKFKDKNGQGLKNNTKNYHLIALRTWLKYISARGIKIFTPKKVKLNKVAKSCVDCLDTEEMDRILQFLLKNKKNIIVLRDKAILEVLFSTGSRVSEMSELKRTKVNFKKGEIIVSDNRIVFLSDSAKESLKKYLDARRDSLDHLFIRHDRACWAGKKRIIIPILSKKKEDGPLTPRSIQRIVEKKAKAAGIAKKITPQTIRHTFANDLLKNGADIHLIQALLGHKGTHIAVNKLKEIHKRFHKN